MSSADLIAISALAAMLAALVALTRRQRPALPPSDRPYGEALAAKVADRLERGDFLAFTHRDYCGTGLRFVGDEYIFGQVVDGELPSSAEAAAFRWPMTDPDRKAFGARADFIAWLSVQSDASMCGSEINDGFSPYNQRLTYRRLRWFADGKPHRAT